MKTKFGLTFLSLVILVGATIFAAEKKSAIAIVLPTQGNFAVGVVMFTEVETGVRVVADLQGLTPGLHGIHIHQFGDLSDVTGASAGGHFNPKKDRHGGPKEEHYHSGDLGNIEANPSGNAHLDVVFTTFRLSGDESIIGRSVVVHQDPDDLKTQPAGNSGKRIGVGVIGVSRQL